MWGNFRPLTLFLLAGELAFASAEGAFASERSGGPALRPPAAPPPADARLPGFGKFHVVRIDREGISPREVRIARGSTVVWFNATPGYSSVVFNEGESLLRATPALFPRAGRHLRERGIRPGRHG